MLKRAPSIAAIESDEASVGLIVHGCHLEADAWDDIVWGCPPDQLGRLPHAALIAWEERSHCRKVVCGTGASRTSDGRLEGEVHVQLLWERFFLLQEFDAFKSIPMGELETLLRRTVVAETTTQNTIEEVREGLRILSSAGCKRAVLISSPTHLPRCLACACRVDAEEPELFHGSVWASPSDTSYHNFSPGDVVVVEPPHRGDRDRDLDSLPFHEMVKRSFQVKASEREFFLRQFNHLLQSFGV